MMLTWSPNSPFVRKVSACAIYAGVADRIENRPMATVDPALTPINPLAKIPALTLDDGRVLIDSRTICEYLDSLHGRPKLFPEDPDRRWRALTDQALADGVAEAAVLLFMEGSRPVSRQWQAQYDRQLAKITRTLARFDAESADFAGRVDIGTIAAGCALGYAGARIAGFGVDWRREWPRLASWFDAFSDHDFMARTAPAPPSQPVPAPE
jgi:glutathione S-transferase